MTPPDGPSTATALGRPGNAHERCRSLLFVVGTGQVPTDDVVAAARRVEHCGRISIVAVIGSPGAIGGMIAMPFSPDELTRELESYLDRAVRRALLAVPDSTAATAKLLCGGRSGSLLKEEIEAYDHDAIVFAGCGRRRRLERRLQRRCERNACRSVV